MSFFEKVIHIGNRSDLDNLFESEKVPYKFWGDHKNRPLAFIKKSVNSKINKIETNNSVLQHEV